jgi:hypothetical protein
MNNNASVWSLGGHSHLAGDTGIVSEELFMSLATTPRNNESESQAGRLCHSL